MKIQIKRGPESELITCVADAADDVLLRHVHDHTERDVDGRDKGEQHVHG
jgi:hypothetical protein